MTRVTDLHDLVDRWLAGFCLSRGVPMRRAGAIVEVDLDAESRRLELVGVELTHAQVTATAARLVGAPDVWCTLFTPEPRGYDLPPGVGVMLHGEALMTTSLAPSGCTTRAVVEPDDAAAAATATVWVGDVAAASGVVAVVGPDAIVDRVRTHDDHRRQGLGTDVMTTLTDWAAARGATTGILAASPDGRALYTRLGWGIAGAMITLAADEAPRP